MISKIITHSGQFHADEIFACALLQILFGEIPIERTRDISVEDMDDPSVWIIDVGQTYNPKLGLFDHHHDSELESSNMLVLDYLLEIGKIEESLHKRLYNAFKSISHIDRNGYADMNGFQMNTFIKSLNSIPYGFGAALNVAKLFIKAKMIDCFVEEESRSYFDSGEMIHDRIKVCESFPVFWKSYDECDFLVAPDQLGKWCLHSKDSEKFPILPTGKEKFLHTAKFLAVYESKDDAVEAGARQAVLHYDW